ncbi:MAG TPA: hypothetical protein DHV67_03135 [Gallionella sp.]|nr:hypothetical protein [Gallionella sp.]
MPTVNLHRGDDGKLSGISERDQRAYAKFRKRLESLGDESIVFSWVEPRSGPYHRRFFAMVGQLFDMQEQFQDEEDLLCWLKVGAGHCDLVPGPHGKPVALPKSIKWAKLDQAEFEPVARSIWAFARSLHASRFLWPHLTDQQGASAIETFLAGFGE